MSPHYNPTVRGERKSGIGDNDFMKIIRHRVNTLAELGKLTPDWGVEIDLRSRGSQLILQHEPYREGEAFEAFLDEWRAKKRGVLVLNPKEDGLDKQARQLLANAGIVDFFFLDLTPPSIVRLALREGERRVALRVSEYESAESALRLAGRVEWIWLDCFSGEPPAADVHAQLQELFRICLVSPELQGFGPERVDRFLVYRNRVDAVCTKYPEKWA